MVKSSQNWWNIRFFHLFRHQFCFKEDKMLILLRWSFIVAEACSVAFDVFVCLRYLEKSNALCCKGHLDIKYKLQHNREAEVFRASARNLANGQLHRVSVQRLAETLSVQVLWPIEGRCWNCISLHFSSNWDGVKCTKGTLWTFSTYTD